MMNRRNASQRETLLIAVLLIILCLIPLNGWADYDYTQKDNADVDNNFVIGFYDKNGVAIYKENGRCGLINTYGVKLTKAEYDSIIVAKGLYLPSSEEYGWYVYRKGEEAGCISKNGKVVKYNPEWNNSKYEYFTGNLMVINNTVTKKYNICNTNGDLLFDDWYEKVTVMPLGGALIEDGESIIEIDDNGDVVAQIQADGETVDRCSEQYAYMNDHIHGKSILRSLSDLTTIIEDCDFIDYTGYHDGLILARRNDKIGYFDERGDLAIPFKYNIGSNSFANGKAVVEDDHYYYFINTAGEELYKMGTGSISLDTHFSKWGIHFSEEDKQVWGFMDEYGNALFEVDSSRYTWCPDLYSSLEYIPVYDTLKEKYGLIKHDGTWILETDYRSVGDFEGEYTYAQLGSLYGIINKMGEWVCDPQWEFLDKIIEIDEEVYIVARKEQDCEVQVYNLKGEWVCPYLWNNSKWN